MVNLLRAGGGCAVDRMQRIAIFPHHAQTQTVERKINDGGGVESQHLTHDQTANNRDAQRPPQLRARAERERIDAEIREATEAAQRAEREKLDAERKAIVAAFPRTEHFKEDIIQAFYDGIRHKPGSTFGNVKADVLADKEPNFRRANFCSVIRASRWVG